MSYGAYHPEGFSGECDAALPQCVKDLASVLDRAQRQFAYDTLRLNRNDLKEVAGVLVDFAVDIHNDIDMWNAYERYNVEFFGVPLSLTTKTKPQGIHEDRIRHLLWKLYPEMISGLILSPQHQDLQHVATAAKHFLNARIPVLPQDAGVKAFLATPNEHGWDVKQKLVWTGTRSYLFRMCFKNYIAERNNGVADIPNTDAFICQECTGWSGLGVIDLLAETLDITQSERRELRSWYEPHLAPYRVLSINGDVIKALNLANKEPYTIRVGVNRHSFKVGEVVLGSLTPWRSTWYWSGQQHLLGTVDEGMVDDIVNTMRRKSSHILCRYWKEYERRIREAAARHHQSTMAYHKTDLAVYADAVDMAADWQKEMRRMWDAAPQDLVQDVIMRYGLKKGRPNISLPDDLVDSSNGIAVFANPEEGKEITPDYNDIVSGLKRCGESLTEAQATAIRGFVTADAISPAFVKRVTAEHGAESIKAAFMLGKCDEGFWLDYLLRSHKGHFYRKRYPPISTV